MRRLALLLLLGIAGACALAPVYAARIAGQDPFRSNVMGVVDGQAVLAPNSAGLGLGVTPIGPGWRGAYLLGADGLGRDVAARLLFGGRTSLVVAGAAVVLCLAASALIGVTAGFLGGAADAVLAGLLDLLWAFPVYLLAICLSLVLIDQGLHLGPLAITGESPALPAAILAAVFVPYGARPVRARILALRQDDFVQAAVALGGRPTHILRRHMLPHVWPVLRDLAPALAALMLLSEATLSVLGLGVQAPGASWGTMLADGQALINSRPLVALAPGVAIALTVLALNALGDA